MKLNESLNTLNELPTPEKYTEFLNRVDYSWIEYALSLTGSASLRKRRLPAEQIVWLVIGMALMRDRSITEVADKLDITLPDNDGIPARSSVSEARQRLGKEAMEKIFKMCAETWGPMSAAKDKWKGLSLFGVDGTSFSVFDSKENAEYFGYAKGARGKSGYPKLRLSAVMALKSHIICGAEFGPYSNGEYHYSEKLWRIIPKESLVILDKGYLSAGLLDLLQCESESKHWLVPAKQSTKMQVVEEFNEYDKIVEIEVSWEAKRKYENLGSTWKARAITYQLEGFPERTLLTSMLDAEKYPAGEIAELYHQRWEIELGYGELKTDMLSTTQRPLRSKSPEMVEQELWGALIAYNLVRLEMERIAEEAGIEPLRISFKMVYFWIMDEWIWCSCSLPGAIPKHLRNLREKVKHFIIPPRKIRHFPRAVKVKMSNYLKKGANF